MRVDAVRGHVDAMVLGILETGPLHGYAIIEALAVRSGGALDLPAGTVYPALHRLERVGWLSSSWAMVGGRRRRSYELTDSGRRQLQTARREWRQFTAGVGAVLGEAPA